MTKHKWAEEIIAYAEGRTIQCNSILNSDDYGWIDTYNPYFWMETLKFRVKPKDPEWYENIPEHGVLCWVSDTVEKNKDTVDRVLRFNNAAEFKFATTFDSWLFATPLTNEEIEAFKR